MNRIISNQKGPAASADSLISIIIPAYKADAHIRETLDGVTGQIYTKWELILVEDGSHGSTEKILREFSAANPEKRVVYHNTEDNFGQGHARNLAFSMSLGSFIAFLDADDIWLPNHIISKLNAFQDPSVEIAYSSSSLFDNESGQSKGTWGPRADIAPDRIQFELARQSFLTPSATVVRRKTFERIGGFDESEQLRNVEDYDFWLRAAATGARFNFVEGNHCLYRKGHPEAATGNVERLNYQLALVLQRNIDLLEDLNPSERNALLARRLFIAGMHNILAETAFAQESLRQACKLNPLRPDYLVASVTSSYPSLLHSIREFALPLQRRFRQVLRGQ